MKLSDQALNPRVRHTVAVERNISDNSAYQEAEFTDKLICTQTQTNLTPSRANTKLIQLRPKQKLSQVIYSLKSSDFVAKIQRQNKQALKKQWMNMKKQHHTKDKQQHNQILKANQSNQLTSNNISNLFNRKAQTKGKFNQFQLHCIGLTQEKDPKQIKQKKEEKRKRSKTQMLIHDHDLEKIGALESSHMHHDTQNFSNTKHLKRNPRQSSLLNDTFSQKFDSKSFAKSDSKPKTYLQKMRQAAQMSFSSENQPKIRHKFSQNSHQKQNHKNQQNSHCLSRSRNPISKTVMVQKIINLRKTFNDKYKKTPKKTHIENSIIQTSYSKPQPSFTQPQFQAGTNPIIPYMSFPVMNLKVPRKVTFQELFQNEKKKMDLLKKYIDNGGVFNSFTNEPKNSKSQSSIFNNQSSSNMMNLSQLSDSKSLLMYENMNDPKLINYLCHGKNLYHGKAKWSELQKEQIRTIKSRSKILPEEPEPLNIESIPTSDPSKSLENDLIESFHEQKQILQQRITTYEFAQMNKNLQKPQIKELRHKYLYSSKRKLLKEEFNKYGISMIEFYGRDENNLRKLNLKCKTEMIMEECLQIEKKVPHNWDRMGKTSANFIKANLQRRKVTSLGKHMEQQKQLNKKKSNFEPWQNQVQCFQEQESTYFPD